MFYIGHIIEIIVHLPVIAIAFIIGILIFAPP
jgi:hypothetical protein